MQCLPACSGPPWQHDWHAIYEDGPWNSFFVHVCLSLSVSWNRTAVTYLRCDVGGHLESSDVGLPLHRCSGWGPRPSRKDSVWGRCTAQMLAALSVETVSLHRLLDEANA